MKELYISPELNLLCLAPEEKLMNSQGTENVNFDDIIGGAANPVSTTTGDIDIDIPLN